MSTLKPLSTGVTNKSNLSNLINKPTPTPQPSPTIIKSSSTLRSLNSPIPTIPLDNDTNDNTKKRSPRRRQSPVKTENKPSSKNIADLLMSIGFTPIDYVLCKDSDIGVCSFVKVIDNLGNIAYVEPDVEGDVSVNGNSTIFTQQKDKTIVPVSIKNGSMGVIGQDLDGVAIECNDEICVLKRNQDQTITENIYQHDKQDLATESIVYPLVKMSLLLGQPIMVRQIIEEIYIKLRQIDYVTVDSRLDKTVEKIKQLAVTVENYNNNQKETSNELMSRMDELYVLADEYKDQELLDEEKDKLQVIEKNIKIRQQKFMELIKLSQAINQLDARIDQIIKEYQDLTSFAQNNFQGLDQIY